MQELFRFYAVRAADQAPEAEQIRLETTSSFQGALRDRGATSSSIASACLTELREHLPEAARELAAYARPIAAFRARLDAATASEDPAPVADWVREDFGVALPDLVAKLAAGTDMLKDVLVALRIERVIVAARPRDTKTVLLPGAGATPSAVASPASVAQLMLHVRVRTALARAGAKPQTMAAMKQVPTATFTLDTLDRVIGVIKKLTPPPTSALDTHRKTLADLTSLILDVRLGCPGRLELETPYDSSKPTQPSPVVLQADYRTQLASTYATLLSDLVDLPGPSIPTDLTGHYVELHTLLEAKASALQAVIDGETPAVTATASAAAISPMIGGHMQLAGVADVHVVLNHVVDYRQAEIAQIENVLLGEKRDRKYRTLLRTEQDTENTTETTTTQEREVKTEDRSDLKTETDSALKESLDIKAGVDFQYKQGDSLKLDINASVGYSRTKDETTKVATEFAKDVTNRAAQKVVQMVRQSIKTKQLSETEETVDHRFDNTGAERTDNISGLYQWIEKIYENVHLTVGGPAAIFDGVVLQPAQRILAAPPATDTALGQTMPPPPLDISPADIHTWNYMSLAAKFGAANVGPPPAFLSNTSFSSAAADVNPQGIAHDLALPDDTQAAWASTIWDAQDKKDDKPDNADSRGSLGTNKLGPITWDGHSLRSATDLLAGERGMLPFAALFYDAIGYELTLDVTCIRTPEAYARWQLGIYTALASARAQAQQAYDEKVARATLQQSYDYGPSPGRVEQLIREELKRCAIGVLAKQAAGKNIFDQLADLYASGDTDEVSRLCLIFEHAFAWENMSYILYPYFWADSRNSGWDLHTSRSENDENWAEFLRAGAARVVVPVRDGFVRLEALGVTDPAAPPSTGPAPNPLQMLQEDITAILDETLTFDDLLSISSTKAFTAAKESALRAEVLSKWVEHEHWFLRTPTELVRLRPLAAKLPTWTWDETADLAQGIAKAWKNPEEDP